MVDSTASVTMTELGTQQLVAEVATQQVTREVADLTSPGGSRPMRAGGRISINQHRQRSGLGVSVLSACTNRMLSNVHYVMRTLRMRVQTK